MVAWWVWVIVAASVTVAALLAYRSWRARQSKSVRGDKVRSALVQHSETVLLCARCTGADTNAVVRCVMRAFSAAHSPLRLRVAIVQEGGEGGGAVDIYDALVTRLHRAASNTGQHFGDKVRTLNLTPRQGGSFQRAFDGWRELHDQEQYVVIVDAAVKLSAQWDVAVVDCANAVPAHVACSAPGPGEFAVFSTAPSFQRKWPIVRGRRFPFKTERPVPSIALHHTFAVFHGPCFGAAPRMEAPTPLYVADVTWSDLMFRGGVRFATVPGSVFEVFANYSDDHLHEQRPQNWQSNKRITLSPQYAQYAGITIERPADLGQDSRGRSESAPKGTETQQKVVQQVFTIGPMAKGGLTPFAMQNGEARLKYGSMREVSRMLAMAAGKQSS